MMETLLSVRGLKVEVRGPLPQPVLHDVGLDLEAGRTVGLVGESGSGKSVTARAILGLLDSRLFTVKGGTALFEGRDLLTLPSSEIRTVRGGRIAYIPQEPLSALNPTLHVGRQLGLLLKRHFRLRGDPARRRAAAVLSQMRVADPERVLDAYPFQLSGGLRQRVVVAAAFLCDPSVLIADEPTTGLDVTTQAEVLALLSERVMQAGTAMLLITHSMGLVWQYCEDALVMCSGRIVERGPTRTVLSTPEQAYTARLLAALPERNPPRTRIAVGAAS